jgi:hypothetical protein
MKIVTYRKQAKRLKYKPKKPTEKDKQTAYIRYLNRRG